jgi:hypothetical protein
MDPDTDQTPGPSPFFIDFKDAKKNFLSHCFLITCPRAHHLQSKKLIFLLKFCVEMIFCRRYISPLNTFMRSGFVSLTNGSGSGRPKTCGSPTLGQTIHVALVCNFKQFNEFMMLLQLCLLRHILIQLAASIQNKTATESKTKANVVISFIK